MVLTIEKGKAQTANQSVLFTLCSEKTPDYPGYTLSCIYEMGFYARQGISSGVLTGSFFICL